MASPTLKTGQHREGSWYFPLRLNLVLPLVTRRCVAALLEVSLVTTSALLPYGIGLYAEKYSKAEPVPLNPVLGATQNAIAKTLAYPRLQLTKRVTPLTNLFWCASLVMPVGVTLWQLYLLGKTGQTTPKGWFGVRVVTTSGKPPGLMGALWREAVGRWGLPLGSAYLLWRYTGAFPDLLILLGLAGLMLLAESFSSVLNAQHRSLHDYIAGTYVSDSSRLLLPYWSSFESSPSPEYEEVELEEDTDGQWSQEYEEVELEEDTDGQWSNHQKATSGYRSGTVTTITLISKSQQNSPNLWLWMRRHPGLTLVIVTFGGMGSVLGTFVGTQIYIQSQANWRAFNQQKNQVFLTLVKQLSSTESTAQEERLGSILALGRIDDHRAVPFLVDLLGQENTPSLIDTLQQTLVNKGVQPLPHLRLLNQSLANDQKALTREGKAEVGGVLAVRHRATKQAISKILTIYDGQVHNANLSNINLSKVNQGYGYFNPILNNLNLSGINFRYADLSGANLQGSRFYGPGEDEHFGTFDDWVSDFSGADLREVNLTGAILDNVLMNRTNLIGATLNRARFYNGSLIGANLSSAQLINADFRRAILENASLTGANLGEAKFSLSSLHGARLGKVSAVGSDFSFADLSQSSWQGANLSRANLSNANLKNVDLNSTQLVGANLRNAQLYNAKLRYANLSAADLRGANLAGADFLGVTFAMAKKTKANQFITLPPPKSNLARIKGVDFANVKNLDKQQLRYICTYGGRHPRCL